MAVTDRAGQSRGGTVIARFGGMDKGNRELKCYIAALEQTSLDPNLAARGFAPGLILFAIPDIGVIFRCRAHGAAIDLEFGAFFALLKFLRKRLEKGQVSAVRVLSSDPEFIFSLSKKGPHLEANDDRRRLLEKYEKVFALTVGYVRAVDNKALVPPNEFPSLPAGRSITLLDDPLSLKKPDMKPFHRGIRL